MQKSVIFLVFYQFSAKNGPFRANIDPKTRRKNHHLSRKIFRQAHKNIQPSGKISSVARKNYSNQVEKLKLSLADDHKNYLIVGRAATALVQNAHITARHHHQIGVGSEALVKRDALIPHLAAIATLAQREVFATLNGGGVYK